MESEWEEVEAERVDESVCTVLNKTQQTGHESMPAARKSQKHFCFSLNQRGQFPFHDDFNALCSFGRKRDRK